jgi:hypothetical protein
MNGGEISGNYVIQNGDNGSGSGGGVYANSGEFTMADGCKIINNTAYYYGGVFAAAKFVMNGGEISGNRAYNSYGGIGITGTATKSFINDGIISGNYCLNIGETSGGVAGGLYTTGDLEMSGGEISGNQTKYSNGAGVYVNGGTFTLKGGAIKQNIVSVIGGGVYVNNGTFSMEGGEVSSNRALKGGGVYVNSGIFTLKSGTISGNHATSTDTSNGWGGGVYFNNGTFNLSGDPVIKDNVVGGTFDAEGKLSGEDTSNVYLWNGRVITLVGNLTTKTPIRVRLRAQTGVFTSGYKAQVTSTDPTDYFISDNDKYNMYFTSAGEIIIGNAVVELTLGNDVREYATIGDAVIKYNEADEDTEKLFKFISDVTLTQNMEFTKSGTIDLNGYKIDGNGSYVAIIINAKDITVTLIDSENADVEHYYTGSYAFQTTSSNTTTTYKGGIIYRSYGTVDNNSMGSIYVKNGKFVMNGGLICGSTGGTYGGGVYVTGTYSTFVMEGGTISNNTASYFGGGVYVANNGVFELVDGEIVNNTATRHGGGVYVTTGTLNIQGGRISGNSATNSSYGYGGGVYFTGSDTSKTFTMTGGTIGGLKSDGVTYWNNTSYNYGGGIYMDKGTLVLSGTAEVTYNKSNNHYGGIYVVNCNFTLSDEASVSYNFTSNSSNGGGIYFGGSSVTFTMTGGKINKNTSTKNAGGVMLGSGTFNMSGGEISGNIVNSSDKDEGKGGGVYISSGTLNISGGKISGNTAPRLGGGVYVSNSGYGDAALALSGDGVISDNSASNGGGVYVYYYNYYGYGQFNMSGGEISGNSASTYGGGIYTRSYTTISDGTISGNTATSRGGGIYSENYTLNITGGTISGNTADLGGGIFAGYTLNLSGATISQNNATSGGGLYVNSTTTMTDGTITGNTVTTSGGGVYVASTFTVNGGTISNNKADNGSSIGDGGGIYIASGTTTINSGVISGNSAASLGGGIYTKSALNINSTLEVVENVSTYSTRITENTSSLGGGIYIASGTTTLNNGSISNNVAQNDGGGVNLNAGYFYLKGGEIAENTATTGYGGGIRSDSILYLYGGKIISNVSRNEGGGVYYASGYTYIQGNPYLSDNIQTYVSEEEKEDVILGSESENTDESEESGEEITIVSNLYITVNGTGSTTSRYLYITGEITSSYVIKVNLEAVTGVFTSSYNTYNKISPAKRFSLDYEGYMIFYNKNSEALVGKNAYAKVTLPTTGEEREYGTFSDAIDVFNMSDNEGSILTLLSNIELSGSAEFKMSGTLDLNGYIISTTKNYAIFLRTSGKELIITDSGTKKSHLYEVDTNGKYIFDLTDDNAPEDDEYEETLGEGEDGSDTTPSTDEGEETEDNGELVENSTNAIKGGIITGAKYYGAIYMTAGTIIMNGGTLAGNTGYVGGVYIYGSSTFTLNGGSICGNYATIGAIFMNDTNNTLNIYNGTISDNVATSVGAVRANGKFNMTGGTITNNQATSNGGVGAVYVQGGTFEFTGGEITNNKSLSGNGGAVYVYAGDFNMKAKSSSGNGGGGGTIQGNEAKSTSYGLGGGVYVNSGTFTMDAGSIEANKSVYGGGVYIAGGTVTLNGGIITGNDATKDGGGVYSRSTTYIIGTTISVNTAFNNGGGVYSQSTVTMSDGEIIDNLAKVNGGGVYIATRFDLKGGTISRNTAYKQGGGVYVNDPSSVVFNVQDAPEISNNLVQNETDASNTVDNNVYLPNGKYVTLTGKLTNSVPIGVTLQYSVGRFTTNYESKMGKVADSTDPPALFFKSENSKYGVGIGVNASGELEIGESVCEVTYDTSSNPVGYTSFTDAVTVFNRTSKGKAVIKLTQDINLTKQHTFSASGTLDLNGCILRYSGTSNLTYFLVVNNSADFTIMDSNPTTENKYDVNSDTGVYEFSTTGSNVLKGGVITGSKNSYGAIYVNGNSTKFTLSGGNIAGNNVLAGGGVFVENGGTFSMTGGSIQGNYAKYVNGTSYSGNGGGVYVRESTSHVYLSGGEISNNSARYGGGVYVVGGYCDIGSVIIKDNTSTYNGGGIYFSGITFTSENAVISNNKTSDSGTGNGGGIYINSGTATLVNTSVSGNTARLGGGIFSSATTTYKSGDISSNSVTLSGTTGGYGGGIYVNGGTFTISDGNISANEAVKDGGGVYVNVGTLKLTGGTISTNTAQNGGGVYTNASFEMSGGTISQNSAYIKDVGECYGGGVYVYSSFTMTGGAINDNKSVSYGGGVYVNSTNSGSTITLSGSPVISGNASDTDGLDNLYLPKNKLITVNALFVKGAQIGVSFANVTGTFTAGYNKNGTRNTVSPATYFNLDYDNYRVFFDGNFEALVGERAVAEVAQAADSDLCEYATIDDALTAFNNTTSGTATLKILEDTTVTKTATFQKGGTLDLNGHIFRNSGSGNIISVTSTANTFTIIDSNPDTKHYYKTNTEGLYVVDDTSTLNASEISGGIITGAKSSAAISVSGLFTLSGGTITGNAGGDCAGVRVSGGTSSLFTMTGGSIIGNTATGNGVAVYVTGKARFVMSDGTITLNYGKNYGTIYANVGNVEIDGGTISNNSVAYAGGIYVSGTLSIRGGTISNNTATNYAGGVWLASGTAEMSGGTITANVISATGNSANGGGVYVTGGTFNMTGGTISNHTVANNGGGVYVYDSSASFIISGGKITLNKAKNGGGAYSASGLFEVSGSGSVEANTATQSGGGVYAYATVALSGGTVTGNTAKVYGAGVCLDSRTNSRINIYGAPDVSDNVLGGKIVDGVLESTSTLTNNVYIPDGKVLTVTGELSNENPLKISLEKYTGKFTTGYNNTMGEMSPSQFFKSENSDYGIGIDSEGEAVVGDTVVEIISQTGATPCEYTTFGDAVIAFNKSKYDSPTVKLLTNIEISTCAEFTHNGTLDLNGYMLKNIGSSGNVIRVLSGSKLTIKDGSSVDNQITHYYTVGTNYMYVLSNTASSTSKTITGGVITGAQLGYYGISVESASTLSLENVTIAGNGGGVKVTGTSTLNINGATITGNRTNSNGAGIYVASSSILNMESGTVSNNYARSYGGGIFVTGTKSEATISGGVISGNTANEYYGGGIYATGGSLYLNGGTIEGNTAYSYGGGICVESATLFSMSEGTITANNSMYGGLALISTETAIISGGSIESNNGTSYSGLYNSGTVTTMSGGSITQNTSENGGGVYNGGTFNLTGGSISNNTSKKNGGGVYNAGTFNMSGGDISGNTAKAYYGGGVYNTGTFTISGGTISGNTALTNGGGVFVNSGKTYLKGGTISGNLSNSLGAGVYYKGGTLYVAETPVVKDNIVGGTMTDGAITGGEAGNVYLPEDKLLNVSGTLYEGAEIVISKYGDTGVFTTNFNTNMINMSPTICFVSENTNYGIGVNADGEAVIGNTVVEVRLTKTSTPVEFTTFADALTMFNNTSGYDEKTLVLLEDTTITSTAIFTQKGNLDLNGHILKNTKGITVQVNSNLTLVDSDSKAKHRYTINNETKAYIIDDTKTGADSYELTGGIITSSAKGSIGVNVSSGAIFTMTGGTIAGNYASRGAGISAYSATVTITNGKIVGNATYGDGGSGIYARKSSKIYIEGGSISNNYANDGYGGGVYVIDAQSSLTMSGGEIADNVAYNYGGVYMYEGAFLMTGGKIVNNYGATVGGVYISSYSSVELNTSPIIIGNTNKNGDSNLYLVRNRTITIGSGKTLADDASVGITLAASMGNVTSGYSVDANGEEPSKYFSSDSTAAVVALKNGEVILRAHEHTWSYFMDENGKITATCTQQDKEFVCPQPDGGSLTFKVPQNAVYSGNAYSASYVDSLTDGQTCEITYTTAAGVRVVTPTNAGEYIATLTLTDNDTENPKTFTRNFVIAKKQLEVPSIDNKYYTGMNQTADVSTTNTYYSVIENEGGTEVGGYNVVLQIKDGYVDNYEWKPTDNVAVTINGEKVTIRFYITKAPLKVTFDNETVAYDGETHTLTAKNVPDGVTVTYKMSDGSTDVNKKELGTYTIIAHFDVGDNYQSVADKTATLTIVSNKVTVDWSTTTFEYANKEYFVTATYKNVEGENVNLVVSVTDNGGHILNAGTYTLRASFKTEDNKDNHYELSNPTVKATVTKRSLLIIISNAESDYLKAISPLSGSRGDGTVADGDDINKLYSLSTTATSKSTVGTYDIEGTTLNDNYNITFTNGKGAYSINKVTSYKVTINGFGGENAGWSYGKTPSWLTGATVKSSKAKAASSTETVGAESEYGTAYYMFRSADESTWTTVIPTQVGAYYVKAVVDGDGVNYDSSESDEYYFEITKMELVINIDAKTSVYGDEYVELTSTIESGEIADGESASDVYLLAVDAKAGADVGTYNIIGTNLDTTNYSITFNNGTGAYVITQREIEIVWGTTNFDTAADENSEYKVEPYYVDIKGNNIDLAVTIDGDEQVLRKAGTYYLTANFKYDETNYKLPTNHSTRVVIGQREIEIIWITDDLVYNGAVHTVKAQYLNKDGTPTYLDVTVAGDKELINAGVYTVEAKFVQGDNENNEYILPAITTTTITIAPQTVEIHWSDTNFDQQNKVQTVTAYYETVGTVKKVDLDVTIIEAPDGAVTVDGKPVLYSSGKYVVKASFNSEDELSVNYKLPEEDTKRVVIGWKEVEIYWNETTFEYDGSTHYVTAYYLVGEDKIPLAVSVKEGGSSIKDAGTYTVEASFVAGGDDAKTYMLPEDVTTQAYVTPMTVDVTWVTTTLTYNGSVQSFVATYNDAAGNPVELKVTDADGKIIQNVGTYNLKVSFANGESNYVLNTDNLTEQEGVIEAKKVTVVWGDTNFAYDGNEKKVTAQYDADGEMVDLAVKVEGNKVIKDFGTYNLTASFANGETNYVIDETTAQNQATVSAKEVKVEWGEVEFTYDGSKKEVTATYTDVGGTPITLNVTADGDLTNAGEYTLTASFAQGEINYTLDQTTASQIVTIAKAKIENVIWDNTDFTYDGTEQELKAAYTNVLDKNVYFAVSVGNKTFKDAGNYTATVSFADDDTLSNNYELPETTSFELVIKQRAITVTIADKSGIYGEEIKELTADVTEGKIIDGDNVYVLSTEATNTSKPATYAITGEEINDNYTVTFIDGEYTIAKSDKNNVTAPEITGWTYGDSPVDPEGAVADFGSDKIVYMYKVSGADDSTLTEEVPTLAGTYEVFAVVENDPDGSYVGGKSAGTEFTIAKRAIIVKITSTSSEYGSPIEELTATVASGEIVNGDDVYTLSTTAQENSNVGKYKIEGALTAYGEANYIVEFTNVNNSYEITKKVITIIWDEEREFSEDGSKHEIGAMYELVEGGTQALTVTADGDLTARGVYIVTASFDVLNDKYYTNYQLPEDCTSRVLIGVKEITIVWNVPDDLTYNGNTFEVGAAYTIDGGDPITLEVTIKEGGSEIRNAGTYVLEAKFVEGDVNAENYVLPKNSTMSLTINKKDVQVIWLDYDGLEYNGSEFKITALYSDAISGEQVTLNVAVDGDKKLINAGEYTLTASFANSETNYALVGETTKTVTIAQKEVTVIWSEPSEFVYDGDPHNVTATYENVITGSEKLYVKVTAGEDYIINAGTYWLKAQFTDVDEYAGNYILMGDTTKVVKVEQKTVEIEWDNCQLTYNGYEQTVGARYMGVRGYVELNVTITSGGDKILNVGEYTLAASFAKNETNYKLPDDVTANVTVSPYVLNEITWHAENLVYDGKVKNVTASYDDLLGVTHDLIISVDGDRTILNAGDYTVSVWFDGDDVGSSNYQLPDNGSMTLTIEKAEREITWVVPDLTYDGAAKTVVASITDLDGNEIILEVNTSDGREFKDAGNYTLVATFKTNEQASENYKLPDDSTMQLTIKASGREVVWEYENALIFSGKEQEVKAYYLDENEEKVYLKVTVEGDDKLINVGEYTLSASFANGETDYSLTGELTKTVNITMKQVTVNWVTTNLTYNGKVQTVEVNYTDDFVGTVSLNTVVIEGGTELKNAGTYKVEAQFAANDENAGNYELIGDLTSNVTIAAYAVDINWDATEFTYSGKEQTVTATYTNVEGKDIVLNVASADGKILKNAGDYEVVASFRSGDADSANYALPDVCTKLITIEKMAVDVIWEDVDLVYSGSEQTVSASYTDVNGGEQALDVTIVSGGTKLKDAGDYTLKAVLSASDEQSANYVLRNDQTLKVTMAKQKIAMPQTRSKEVSYTGSELYSTVLANMEGVKVEGDGFIDPGIYTVYVELADGGINTQWADGTTANILFTVTVVLKIDKPTEDLTVFTYNGSVQVYNVVRQDKWKQLAYTISGNLRTDADSYIVTVSLNTPEYIRWNVTDIQEQTADLEFTFKINMAENKISNLALDSWTYGDTPNTPTATAKFGTVKFTYATSLDGQYTETVPTNAGTYFVKAEVAETSNYYGVSATRAFTINKMQVSKPASDKSVFTYNGTEQIYDLETSRLYTIEDNEQTDAGSYDVTVNLNDKQNYEWADGTTDELTYKFTINGGSSDYLWLVYVLAGILMAEIAGVWVYIMLHNSKKKKGSTKTHSFTLLPLLALFANGGWQSIAIILLIMAIVILSIAILLVFIIKRHKKDDDEEITQYVVYQQVNGTNGADGIKSADDTNDTEGADKQSAEDGDGNSTDDADGTESDGSGEDNESTPNDDGSGEDNEGTPNDDGSGEDNESTPNDDGSDDGTEGDENLPHEGEYDEYSPENEGKAGGNNLGGLLVAECCDDNYQNLHAEWNGDENKIEEYYDDFIITLNEMERSEFINVFIKKNNGSYSCIPDYIPWGHNRDFFMAVFIHLDKVFDSVSKELLEKMYCYNTTY